MNLVKIGTHILGSIAFAAMQWLILIYISKFLGIDYAGAFSYYLAIFAPLAILCALNLKSVYSADSYNKFQLEEYESLRSIFIFIFIIAGIAVLALEQEYFLMGCMIFSIKLIEVCSELIYGVWVRDKKPQYYGYSKILKLFSFIFLSGFIILIGREEYIYIVYPLAFFIGFYFFDLRFSSIKIVSNFKSIKVLFLSVLPFVLTSFLISFNTSIPRFFIDHYYDKKLVAEFMYLIYFITLMTLPLNSLFQAILPRIQKDKKNILIFTLIYVFTFSAIFYFFCDLLLMYFYGYQYPIKPEIKSLMVLILVFQALIVYMNILYVSSMKFKKIFFVTLSNTFLIIALNFIFIRYIGYEGVYYASVLSFLILLLNLTVNYYIERKNVH